jgi:hypothetical protein
VSANAETDNKRDVAKTKTAFIQLYFIYVR